MSAQESTNVCPKCRGTGHDLAARPIVERQAIKTPRGQRIRSVTVQKGSGCFMCLGLGIRGPRKTVSLNGGW